MKRTCFLCGADAAKGAHYLTIKTPDSTMQFKFSVCEPCGKALNVAAGTFFTEFVTAYREALAKENAKND